MGFETLAVSRLFSASVRFINISISNFESGSDRLEEPQPCAVDDRIVPPVVSTTDTVRHDAETGSADVSVWANARDSPRRAVDL